VTTIALASALARQSKDALAAEFVRRWEPKPPDKRRSARSFAGEIRKLARGRATWFLSRPEAARLLAKILNSTPEKLGILPYEVQSRSRALSSSGTYRWETHATRTTLEAAEDLAWSLLTRHGGDWRVLYGARTIASGAGYRPGEDGYGHDRTAVWSRVKETAPDSKKRRRP
jgi:hypothetical protein